MSYRLQIIRFRDSQLGRVWYRPGGTYGPFSQSDYQILIMQRGYADVHVGSSLYRVEAGQSRLLPVDETFRISFSKDLQPEHTWCLLSPSLIKGKGLSKMLSWQTVTNSHSLNMLVASGLELEGCDFDKSAEYFDSLAECVFREYVRLTSSSRRTSIEERIDRALDVMHRRMQKSLSVGDIAEEVGMSRQHLSKVFAEQIGQPVAQYLWELRIKKAHALLCETGLSLTEIADYTGFQTPFHLSRRIKQFYGQSPREIRRSAKGS